MAGCNCSESLVGGQPAMARRIKSSTSLRFLEILFVFVVLIHSVVPSAFAATLWSDGTSLRFLQSVSDAGGLTDNVRNIMSEENYSILIWTSSNSYFPVHYSLSQNAWICSTHYRYPLSFDCPGSQKLTMCVEYVILEKLIY